DAAEFLGGGLGFFRGVGDDAGEHRHLVLLEKVSCLVLVKIHSAVLRGRTWLRPQKISRCREIGRSTSLLLVGSCSRRAACAGQALQVADGRALDARAVGGEARTV